MAKEKQVTTIRDLQRRLQELAITYGTGAHVTVGENLEVELVTDEDLAEESPEESAARAERQQKAALEQAEKAPVHTHAVTMPLDALRPKEVVVQHKASDKPKT